jgi:nucleoside-diphosphate-sugar epimerase
VLEEDLDRICAAPLPWDRLFGKSILVTGANGFVAAYMIESLLRLNERLGAKIQVIALVRSAEKAMRRFAYLLDRPDLTLLVQDVRTPYSGTKQADFIVHAASQASPKYFGTDPAGTFETNVIGTLRMLELAREARSESFLFLSSGEVYGLQPDLTSPVKETDYGYVDPTNVRSCYAEGKRSGEMLCACWHAQYGVPSKIVRLSHTYGPGMDADDGRVFADFVADVVARRNIVIKSDGSARRPFCYLADATIAFFTVLLLGANGEAYNVGSETETSVLELANLLCRLFPERGCQVIRQERKPGDPYVASPAQGGHFDISKVRALGWEPTTSCEVGFKRTVDSYEL